MQYWNIEDIFLVFFVSNEESFKEVKTWQYLNIFDISSTWVVLKLYTSNLVIEPHPSNIFDIFFTLLVSYL